MEEFFHFIRLPGLEVLEIDWYYADTFNFGMPSSCSTAKDI
jgi:hypothetical protein